MKPRPRPQRRPGAHPLPRRPVRLRTSGTIALAFAFCTASASAYPPRPCSRQEPTIPPAPHPTALPTCVNRTHLDRTRALVELGAQFLVTKGTGCDAWAQTSREVVAIGLSGALSIFRKLRAGYAALRLVRSGEGALASEALFSRHHTSQKDGRDASKN